uniref:Uncharacterized protein n=1 Tax=Aegilops tauschii subsp. strangulata TaxID=200361 RepID=A0A453J8R7_AEGTS
GRVRWQPRSRRGLTAAIHLADKPPDGPHRGSDGLDCATELSIASPILARQISRTLLWQMD